MWVIPDLQGKLKDKQELLDFADKITGKTDSVLMY